MIRCAWIRYPGFSGDWCVDWIHYEGFDVSVSSSVAYLLVYHGSRDPRPSQATERLAQFVRLRLEDVPHQPSASTKTSTKNRAPSSSSRLTTISPFERLPAMVMTPRSEEQGRGSRAIHTALPLVGTACLEKGRCDLHQQIIDFGHRAAATGIQTIRIVPLFLLKGVHVAEDLPSEVQLAQRALPELSLKVSAHLGSHPGLKGLVQDKLLAATTADAWLLLAHGSRRPKGNSAVQALAQALGGTTAYWSVPPNLETQVIHHIQQGVQRLAILPYFLFTGTTTDALVRRTEDLAERFPSIGFHLLPPLGPTPDLANLVVDLALGQLPLRSNPTALPLRRLSLRQSQQASSLVS